MCCFSRPVKLVTNTTIFARPEADHHQVLAYAMRLGLTEDVAMILPLPVPPGSSDDAVTFIELSGFPDFFEKLEKAFPPMMAPQSRGARSRSPAPAAPKLKVHRVGLFEASFVPSPKDFDRLDARFRLPEGSLDALPQYADWGFAVFKLHRPASGLRTVASALTRGRASSQDYHPMAFRFPRRDPSQVFFPTVHIHDGEVHAKASFAHRLYLQGAAPAEPSWLKSLGPLGEHVEANKSAGLIDAGGYGYQRALIGVHPNEDTYVPQ